LIALFFILNFIYYCYDFIIELYLKTSITVISRMKKHFILAIIGLIVFSSAIAQKKYMIMVSLDGFRWDYCSKATTPVFDSIAKYGVKAESLMPSFPSKTFPNHFTLVTGLYPDHHGIVNNIFYCPEFGEIYKINDRSKVENGEYYSGKPIWNLAEEQGVKSASFFWVGSEADINGQRPSYWKKYEHNFPFKQRVDTVLSWLQLPENERPHLILLYFHEPDSKGHKYGPDSKEIKELIPRLDSLIGQLMNGIQKLDIKDEINVIITTDHGMSSISDDRVVNLQNYLKQDWVERIEGSNPVFNIWTKPQFIDSVDNALKNVEHIKCWKNGELPERLHYGHNPRTGTFTVVADSSWSLATRTGHKEYTGGAHGYDNQNIDMHGIFYAIGPDFKTGYKTGCLRNIDIYPLIGHILGLKIPQVDGDLERIKQILSR